MAYAESVLDLIGNTPLVRLRRSSTDRADGLVLAKVEYLNPGGSVKDRIAAPDGRRGRGERRAPAGRHDRRADQRQHRRGPGHRRPGPGLPVHLRVPRQGARATRSPCSGPTAPRWSCARPRSTPSHPDSYYSVSDRLVREIPGAWKPDQYANPDNPASHVATTGPEIWEQTEGRITHFVAGIGTGGTITGTGRYLKDVSDGRVQVDRRRPRGLGVLRRQRPAVPGRGRRRGLLADHLRPGGRRPGDRRVATRTASP